ncbi:MAG: hypothetical protein NC184_05260 [Roseburia sp.]|nr:hypothetical protein [Roseburia sp.]
MASDNNYGYKVCYRRKGKSRLKVYLVTNTYDGAMWNVRWYENNAPPDRKTHEPIKNVIWLILPIKSYLEYKWLWRGCPF